MPAGWSASRRRLPCGGGAHGAFSRAAQGSDFHRRSGHSAGRRRALFLALLLRRTEARIDAHGVVEESARVVVASLVLGGEPAAVREERRERARGPLLDRVSLGHGERHAELAEEIERDTLLEVEHLIELVGALRRAANLARRNVHDRRVDAKLGSVPTWRWRTLHDAARAQQLAGAHIGRRVGRARLLELHLIEQRLHPRALDERELRRAREIGREQIGEAALQVARAELSAPVKRSGSTAIVVGDPAGRRASLPAAPPPSRPPQSPCASAPRGATEAGCARGSFVRTGCTTNTPLCAAGRSFCASAVRPR